MLDLFTIFSKGGIVLWCFQGTSQLFTPSVNALIKSVILQVSYIMIYSRKLLFLAQRPRPTRMTKVVTDGSQKFVSIHKFNLQMKQVFLGE